MFHSFVLACLLSPNQVSLLGKTEIAGTATDLSGLSGKLNDGSPANLLGGIGSALASGTKPGEYFVLPDRGPGDGAANYPCRWHQVTLSLAQDGSPRFTQQKTILLQDKNGQPFQGLAADLKNRLDPEGLRVGPWPACVPQRRNRVGPAFYVAEEYGPKVSIFQQDGTLAFDLPTPAKLQVAKPNQDAETELAQNKAGRQPNKGFEGLALDPEGRELWAATQGPLIQEKKASGGKWCRLVRYNLESGRPDGEFVYPLDSPTCGISELLWVGPGRLLVLERDSFAGREAKFKRVYLAKLGKATDVSPWESLTEVREPIQILEKKLVVDLLDPKLGLAGDRFPPKWEGMAWGEVQNGDPVLWLISDNDFVAKNNTWVLALKIPAVMLRD
jgi:hypothetical protein